MNDLELFTIAEDALRSIIANPPPKLTDDEAEALWDGEGEKSDDEDDDFDPEAVVENAIRAASSSVVKKTNLRYYFEAYAGIIDDLGGDLVSSAESDIQEQLEEIAYGIWLVYKAENARKIADELAVLSIAPKNVADYLGDSAPSDLADVRDLHETIISAMRATRAGQLLVFRGDHI